MDMVLLVIGLALVEFMVFGFLVGQARSKHDIQAPATSGHPEFDRRYRVHQNTLEQLVVFIPAILIFQLYWSPALAALIGLAFVVGRVVYYRGYVAEPSGRSAGFAIGFIAQAILLIGAVAGALIESIG